MLWPDLPIEKGKALPEESSFPAQVARCHANGESLVVL
jgi:hypothetical protein